MAEINHANLYTCECGLALFRRKAPNVIEIVKNNGRTGQRIKEINEGGSMKVICPCGREVTIGEPGNWIKIQPPESGFAVLSE